MKTFAALYKKELKSIRSLAFIIISMILFMFALEFCIYLLTYVFTPDLKIRYLRHYFRNYEYRFLRASIYMLPVIFLFSLIFERKTGTHHQMLSLPVHPSQVILAKFTAVFSIGVLISMLNTLSITNTIHTLYQWLQGGNVRMDWRHNIVPVDFNYLVNSWLKDYVWRSMLSSIQQIGLFCSLVLCVFGVIATSKRYKMTIAALTFLGILSLYMLIGRILYNGFSVYNYTNLLTLCTIPVLLITGMKLIDKYGEV